MDASIVEQGVPSLLLMENAAFSLYLSVREVCSKETFDAIVVFAGKGGNGGDGMALLRILVDRGCRIPLILVPLFEPDEISGDTATNYRLLPPTVKISPAYRHLSGNILFIDAMLGTGLSQPLKKSFLSAVRFINHYPRKKVIAVDVPTGLSGDTGETFPEAVRADITVSLGIIKSGLFLGKGPHHVGKVHRGGIGIPPREFSVAVLEESDFAPCQPPLNAHKRINGRLLVIGGGSPKIGASFIAAEAFLAAGGGLATVAVPEKSLLKLAGQYPALMLTTPDEAMARPEQWDVVICGPGLAQLSTKLVDFLKKTSSRLILDAGMFDYMDISFLSSLSTKEVIFTPHPGELSRVSSRMGIKGAWEDQVFHFPLARYHLLYAKNTASFIRSTQKTFILPHGARALSFGGTGDALAGILASFAARMEDLEQAAINGALLHRSAGIILETSFSPSFHRISTFLDCVGTALRTLERGLS